MRVGNLESIQHDARVSGAGVPDVFELEEVLSFQKSPGKKLDVAHPGELTLESEVVYQHAVQVDPYVVIGLGRQVGRSLDQDLKRSHLRGRYQVMDLKGIGLGDGSEQEVP